MDPHTEAQVARQIVEVAVDHELVGPVEHGGIVTAGAVHVEHAAALRNRHAADFGVGQGRAEKPVDRPSKRMPSSTADIDRPSRSASSFAFSDGCPSIAL